MQIKQCKGQQYPEVNSYKDVQSVQQDCETQFTQPNEQGGHWSPNR